MTHMLNSLTGLVAFVLVLGIIVLFHEAGHFVAAKSFGMRVPEFAIGWGPKLAGLRRGDTLYSLRAIPIGGFVRIIGMDPNEDPNVPGGFSTKPVWARLITLLAGCTMNFVLAALIFWLISWSRGIPTGPATNRIADLEPSYPAAKSGVLPDDRILSASATVFRPDQLQAYRDLQAKNAQGGSDTADKLEGPPHVTVQPVVKPGGQQGERWTASEVPGIRWIIEHNAGLPVQLAIGRDNHNFVRTVSPMADGEGKDRVGRIGVEFEQQLVKASFFAAIAAGAKITWVRTVDMVDALGHMLGGLVRMVTGHHSTVLNGLGGPVKIESIVSQQAQRGVFPVLMIAAILSIEVGLLNLIPFPALDGSRIAFQLIELFARRRIDPRTEASVHYVGFVALLLLMLFITYRDIVTWGH